MASENTKFWGLLCTVPTFMAFFNDQRKDLGDPSCSSCPEAVWDAHVKTYLIFLTCVFVRGESAARTVEHMC